jgi:hypothetical protein
MCRLPHGCGSHLILGQVTPGQTLCHPLPEAPAVEPLELRLLLHAAVPLALPGELDNHLPAAIADASPRQGPLPLTVTFDATASHDANNDDLKFLWNFGDRSPRQRGPIVRHTYQVRGQFFARLTVFDGHGGKDTSFFRILAGESVPNAVIFFPGQGQLYQAGATFTFSGNASDLEDGPLPPSSLTWTITLHANRDSVVLDQIPGVENGSFRVPDTLPNDPRQFLRLTLAAEDSFNIVGRTSIDLTPQLASLTLNTSVPGLTLRFDNRPLTTPRTFQTVLDSAHTISAPLFQQIGNTLYEFVSWSDGRDATHDFTVPFPDTTLTALYRVSQVLTNPFGPKTPFSTRRIR